VDSFPRSFFIQESLAIFVSGMIGDYIPILYVAAVPKLVFAEFGLGPLSITAFDLVEPITAMSRKIGKLRNRTLQGSKAAVICFPK